MWLFTPSEKHRYGPARARGRGGRRVGSCKSGFSAKLFCSHRGFGNASGSRTNFDEPHLDHLRRQSLVVAKLLPLAERRPKHTRPLEETHSGGSQRAEINAANRDGQPYATPQ